jgi:hypothetical protein
MIVKIIPLEKKTQDNLLAGAELHFEESDGPLAGLKLIGFSIWERRGGDPTMRNVTFPARKYQVKGEARAFALLRPQRDVQAQEPIRRMILATFATYEREQADATAFDTGVTEGMAMARTRRRLIS